MKKRFIVTLAEETSWEVYDDTLEVVVMAALVKGDAEAYAAWLEEHITPEINAIFEEMAALQEKAHALYVSQTKEGG